MSNYSILMTLLTSFLLTEAIELPAAWILGIRSRSGLLLTALVNVITNPAIVYIYIVLVITNGRYVAHSYEYVLEVAVLAVETWLYASTPGMLKPEELPLGRLIGRVLVQAAGSLRAEKLLKMKRIAAAFALALLLNAASYWMGVFINSL